MGADVDIVTSLTPFDPAAVGETTDRPPLELLNAIVSAVAETDPSAPQIKLPPLSVRYFPSFPVLEGKNPRSAAWTNSVVAI